MQRDQQEHEEIVQGLTNSIMDENRRAQKAEVSKRSFFRNQKGLFLLHCSS